MILKSNGRRDKKQNSISTLKKLITHIVVNIQHIPLKENESTFKAIC